GKPELNGSIDLAQQKAGVEITGEAGGDHLGQSLAIADINGDGKMDLVVGAPSASVGTRLGAGKVYGVYGPLIAGSSSINEVAALTIMGTARSGHFGSRLATGFIHTNKGPAMDLVVSATGSEALSTGGATIAGAGAVFGFFGGPTLGKTIES